MEGVQRGRPVETRVIALGEDGRWQYASYVWQGDDAVRAPARGVTLTLPGGRRYEVPSEGDCIACHAGARSPVLGFAALQLGPAVPALLRDGLLRNAPAGWATQAPEFIAADAIEHAARGYLHGNCAHCHFDGGVPVPLRLALDVGAPPAPVDGAAVLKRAGTRNPRRLSGFGSGARWAGEICGAIRRCRLVVGTHPTPRRRLASPRNSPRRAPVPKPDSLLQQMPPLGTREVDAKGLALLAHHFNPEKKP